MLDLRKFSPRRFDWILCGCALLLVALGLTAIYSVDLSRGSELLFFKKQLVAALLGLGLLVVGSLTHPSWFRTYATALYGVAVLLLVGVLVAGTPIRGTRGWFVLGNFSFQPVEFAKAAAVLMLASITYHFGRRYDRPLFFFGTLAVVLVLMGLVLGQPDLGSALIVGGVWVGLVVLLKVPWRYLAGLALIGTLVGVGSWFFLLKPYQQERLTTFLYPERDALGAGYTVTQATIAIGSGRLLGRGLGFGSQSQLRFLPEAHTDFIFSVIAEELGLAGVLVLVTLFGGVLWRLLLIMRRASDDFISAAAAGIALLFFCQFFINVGANLGLVPVTGITLPLLSYGGSSLLINLALIGVAESLVSKRY